MVINLKCADMKYIVVFLALFPLTLTAQKVGVNTTAPDANLHVRGASSIGFPNLRVTDTIDNFARIKLESEVAPGRFWDIAASSTEGFTRFNLFFQNDTSSLNFLSIWDDGSILRRSFTNELTTHYYTEGNDYRGSIGFEGPVLKLRSYEADGHIEFYPKNVPHVTLDGKTIAVLNTGASVFLGTGAGSNDNETFNRNVAVGDSAMHNSTNGARNVAIGQRSMFNNLDGHSNVAIGADALNGNLTGDGNVAIGNLAGQNASLESYNVFLGYRAGRDATESHRLYIDNSPTSSPLIYGEFDNDLIRINGAQKVTGELDIEKTGVGLRMNGDEALWYNDTYFSWGYGADYNYFADDLRIGDLSGTPVSQIHIRETGNAAITLESVGAGNDAMIQFTEDASQGQDHQWTIRRDDSDSGKMKWLHGGFHKMTLTLTGKLGLGSSMSNPTHLLHLGADDAAKPGTSSWTISSDRRLKQNIQPFTDGLREIMLIRPVTYQYNSTSKYDSQPEYVGVVAQELRPVTPYMVYENEEGYLSVNNSAMTYLLINAVQEQQRLIEALQAHTEQLERRLAELEE